jgi:hypothetical protein
MNEYWTQTIDTRVRLSVCGVNSEIILLCTFTTNLKKINYNYATYVCNSVLLLPKNAQNIHTLQVTTQRLPKLEPKLPATFYTRRVCFEKPLESSSWGFHSPPAT